MAQEKARLRICRFTAENFKKLKVVDITPAEGQNVIQITGKNEAGKSSVLDAIWAILEWADAKKEIVRPIRDGSTSTNAMVDLGDLVVTRTWTAGGSYLTVANKEGAVYKSPQAVLDALKGHLSFDPLEFANMDEKKQMDLFFEITGLGKKIQEIDARKAKAYDERTSVNREIRDLTGRQRVAEQAGALGIVNDPEVPDQEIQVAELMAAIGKAQGTIAANNEIRKSYEEMVVDLGKAQGEIQEAEHDLEELQDRLKAMRQEYANAQAKAASLNADVEQLKDPDLDTLMARANGADDTNRKVRAKKQYQEIAGLIKAKQEEVARLEGDMEVCDNDRVHIFQTTKMPIEGLTAGPEGVLFRGIPFSQCSSAEKLRVSTAIAMALNPSLRVIRITDGSLLDSANMAEIAKMAKENDFQIWIETVDETGKVGVYIEDGEIKTGKRG